MATDAREHARQAAEEAHLGKYVPEGDGWNWEWEPDERAIAIIQRHIEEAVRERELLHPVNDRLQARAFLFSRHKNVGMGDVLKTTYPEVIGWLVDYGKLVTGAAPPTERPSQQGDKESR